MPRAELTLFAHIAVAPRGEIDLAQTSLLIAEDEYPGLDVAAYIERSTATAPRRARLLLDARQAGRPPLDGAPRARARLRLPRARLRRQRQRLLRPAELVAQRRPRSQGRHPDHARRRAARNLRARRRRGGRRVVPRPLPGALAGAHAGRSSSILSTARSSRARGCASSTAASPASRATPIRACSSRPTRNRCSCVCCTTSAAFSPHVAIGLRLRGVLERLEILTPSDDLRREIVSLGGESPLPPAKQRILN